MPLRIRTAGIEVDVKMKPVGNEIMVPQPEIQMRRIDTGDLLMKVRVVADRKFLWIGHGKELATETRLIDPETGKQVPSSEALEILSHYSYKLVDSKGNVVDEREMGELIEYYYVDEKGEEHVVRPFERTQLLDIPPENWVPSTVVDEFVITAVYELYTEKKLDIVKLWELAEKMLKEDKVGVTTYSHGRGFVSYYAFLCPIMVNGKFGWLLKLTDTKMRFDHLMEIPAKIPLPVKQAPTLERLPPVQHIVATAKKRSNSRQAKPFFFFSGCFLDKKSNLEELLYRVRLKRARESDAKQLFKGIMDEVYRATGHSTRRCWEIAIELVADHLGIIEEPWRYSLPDLPKSPLFKGEIKPAKREFPKDLAERVRRTGLIEEFVEAARAKPWDYIGEVFVEERLANNRLGQMLTPKSVVQLMLQMVMADYFLKKERAWIDAETLLWAAQYTFKHGPPTWASKALERASKNVESLKKPQTILDPAVGTGRFLIEASLMYPDEPLVLFGIDIDVWMYRACLVNMALFSRHPYSIICANSLLIDPNYAGPSSPLWDYGNLWEPADISKFYIKPPPITADKFNLAEWIKIRRK